MANANDREVIQTEHHRKWPFKKKYSAITELNSKHTLNIYTDITFTSSDLLSILKMISDITSNIWYQICERGRSSDNQ